MGKSIITEASKIFATEDIENAAQVKERLLIKIRNTYKYLNNILNGRKYNSSKLTSQMKWAYSAIMEIRTLLLGKNEAISYRLYFHDSNGKVSAIDINSTNIKYFIQRDQKNLELKKDKTLQKILTKGIENSKINNVIDAHYNDIMNCFDSIQSKNQGGIRYIINKRGENFGPSKNTLYNSSGSKKIYNRGWIDQGFDQTLFEIYNEEQLENFKKQSGFEKEFFKQLGYDRVGGFKGGDSGLIQIKSNMSSFVSLKYLTNTLKELEDILTADKITPQALSEKIKDTFLNQGAEEKINEITENTVNKVSEQLIKLNKLR